MNRIAGEFEKSVGGIVAGAASAATNMQRSAQSLSAIAKETTQQSTTVAAAAQQTTANVQTVAAAAEELSTSGAGNLPSNCSLGINGAKRRCSGRPHQCNGGRVAGGDTEDRRGDGTHSKHRRTDQPLGLKRDDRSRAGRRGRQGLCRSGKRSEGAVDSDREGDGGDHRSDPGDPRRYRGNGRGEFREIGATIGKIDEIATTIAAAVEEQGAATQEISRSVQQAAQGTQGVMQNIAGVTQASGQVGTAAELVLGSAGELAKQSERLKQEVESFLATVRAA